MKSIFVSMNTFGYDCLEYLLAHNKHVDLVLTLQKKYAKNISDFQDFTPLSKKYDFQLKKIRHINTTTHLLQKLRPNVIFVLGWSQIINREILNIPTFGCIGTHPALLPKNRGRAAIPWHFINKERYGGITFFYLSDGVDNGPIIAQRKFPITKNDNASTYYQKMTKLTQDILLRRFDQFISKKVVAKKQDESQATYLQRRRPEDSRIDFHQSAEDIHNLIRGVSFLYPPAFFSVNGKKIKILRSRPIKIQKRTIPGRIYKKHGKVISIETGSGIIKLAIVNYPRILLRMKEGQLLHA